MFKFFRSLEFKLIPTFLILVAVDLIRAAVKNDLQTLEILSKEITRVSTL